MDNETLRQQVVELCETFQLDSLAQVKIGTEGNSSVTLGNNGLIWTRRINDAQKTQYFESIDEFVFTVCERDLIEQVRTKMSESAPKGSLLRYARRENILFALEQRFINPDLAFHEERNLRIEKRKISQWIRKHKMNTALGLDNPALIYANTGQRWQKIGNIIGFSLLALGFLFTRLHQPKTLTVSLWAVGTLITWWSMILAGGDLLDRWKLGYLKWQKSYYSAFAFLIGIVIYGVMTVLGVHAEIAKVILYATMGIAVFHVTKF